MRVLQDTWRIARFDLMTLIRTKRALVALLIYLAGALATGGALVWVENQFGDKIQMARNAIDTADALSSIKADAPKAYEAFATITGGDEATARHLLHMPLVLLGFFWTTLTFLPLLIALVSYDIVNSEVNQRSARFVLLRTSRLSLLLGKMLSHLLLFLAVTVAANVALFVYAWVELPAFDLLPAAGLLLRFWLLTVPFGFCYIALAALVSSLVDGAGLSMAIMVGVLIGLGILSSSNDVGFLSPSYYKMMLWSPSLLTVMGGGLAFVVFGLLFLGGASARLRWRDL